MRAPIAIVCFAAACGAPVAVEVVTVDDADEGEGEGETDADGEGEGEGDADGEGEGEGEGEGDDCPAGVVCVDVLPFTAAGSTVGGDDVFDGYACAPGTDESGPERLYRVRVPGSGTLGVVLDDAAEDASDDSGAVDVDVHLLSDRSADACLDRGDRRAAATVGEDDEFVWVVLDSFAGDDSAGAYVARFDFVARLVGEGDNPLIDAGVSADAAGPAFIAWQQAQAAGLVGRTILTVIDFALPSTERRLWTVDMDSGALLAHDRVSHGSGSNSPSNPALASSFSNTSGSLQSSLGLSRTAETYDGDNGYSLRLDGLEPSNDNMRDRAIVMHGAAYAEDEFVDDNGYLGRSSGCPAVAMSRSAALIDLVKEGTLLFSWFPDDEWLATSPFLD